MMKYVVAYALLSLSDAEKDITAERLEKFMRECGIICDAEQCKLLVRLVDGRAVDELVKNGLGKIVDMQVSASETVPVGK